MPEQVKFDRSIQFFNRASGSFREHSKASVTIDIPDGQPVISALLEPVLQTFRDLRIRKISIKASAPIPQAQWLTELEIDFLEAKIEFRIKTYNVPCSLSQIHEKVESMADLKFLHLRYVALSNEDEAVLQRIVNQNTLSVLFLGVTAMQGDGFLEALSNSTSLETVALVWLNLDPTDGHFFPVINFLEMLDRFTSIKNLVLLPFTSNDEMWQALFRSLENSSTLEDFMLSGEAGCELTDDIVSQLATRIHRTAMKRIRLNNAKLTGDNAMQALCDLIKNSNIDYVDLASSRFSPNATALFTDNLPLMAQLKTIDLRQIVSSESPRTFIESILNSVNRSPQIEDVMLTYTPETMDLKDAREYYLLKKRSESILTLEQYFWPTVFAQVGSKGSDDKDKKMWKSLLYDLLRERVDVLLFANESKKRKAADLFTSCKRRKYSDTS
jgi:hypothetical protein